MPEKINKKKEIKTNSDVFEIYLGTFNDDVFTWYSIKKFKDATQAYKEFKKYVNTQLKYTDEELKKVWDTGRLDIELRQGNKLLNWVGIYSREVKELSKAEEKEAEEGKVKKDAVTPTEIFKRFFREEMPKEIHDADGYPHAICDKIQFFINAKKGEKIPTEEYNFFDVLQELNLDMDDVTEIVYKSEDAVRRRLDRLGKHIVNFYLPQHEFKFKDIDLSYGDTISIKFINPTLTDDDFNPIEIYKPNLRVNYKKPWSNDVDLYYKTYNEVPTQSLNKYGE